MKKIQKGSKIGVLAPAFQPKPERLQKGIDYLKSLGYSVVEGLSLYAKHGYLAGSDQLRLDDIHQMFADPEIDAIICARGGWGCLRLLDQLDYELVKSNPKLFIGYSDVTTLQLAFWTHGQVPSLSGPMVAVEMGTGIEEFTATHFWGQLFNPNPQYSIHFNPQESPIGQHGQAVGTLLGGCLSMVAHQLGTPYSPDYNDCILFLEDIGEEPYRIDRYLAQMKQAGVFENIRALILGNFIDCENQDADRPSFTVDEVLQDYFSQKTYPVIYNFPYGHGMVKVSLPIGVPAKIDTESALLELANPLFNQ